MKDLMASWEYRDSILSGLQPVAGEPCTCAVPAKFTYMYIYIMHMSYHIAECGIYHVGIMVGGTYAAAACSIAV